MTFRTLIWRSLRFHWRSHLGVVIGAAIGSAALIGALIVGDSVKGSLRERASNRLGWTVVAMSSGDHLFSTGLVAHYRPWQHFGQSWEVRALAMLRTTGVATRPDGTARANVVNVFGIEDKLGPIGSPLDRIPAGTVVLNQPLANRLAVHSGDEIVLRIQSIGGMAGDMVMAPKADAARQMRLKIAGIAGAQEMGDFSLNTANTAPLNAFVRLDEIGEKLGSVHEANTLLLGDFSITRAEQDQRKHRALNDFGSVIWNWQKRFESLIGKKRDRESYVCADPEVTLEHANFELNTVNAISDWGVWLRADKQGWIEIISQDIFIEPAVATSACCGDTNTWRDSAAPFSALTISQKEFLAAPPQPILTYLANLITVGSNSTPYSMVTAAGAPWTPVGLRDDEILLNQWLADDLSAKAGDVVTLVYFDPESGARLAEKTNTFRVHSIVPMEMPWADRTLMPQFPGIEKAETTAQWDTAFPLVNKIRSQDDEYWTQYRGTPKAFITLAAGQKMWANRFGNLTAIRFPIPTNGVGKPALSAVNGAGKSALTPALSPGERGNAKPSSVEASVDGDKKDSGEGQAGSEHRAGMPGEPAAKDGRATAETFRAALEQKILATLKPEELGLRFEPVREQALKAAEQSQDFGGLFIGFSLFVIVAALLLMAMLFQFSLEQRAAEIGTLLALGFTPKQVRRLFRREGAALAFIGGLIGTVGGIGYARMMLHGLTTIWRDAVGVSSLKFFITAQSLAIGLFASTLVAVFTLWLALRKQARRPARELLSGEDWASGEDRRWKMEDSIGKSGRRKAESENGGLKIEDGRGQRSRRTVVGIVASIFALGLVGWMLMKGDTANAEMFFSAGALLLIAGLSFLNAQLRVRSRPTSNLHLPSASKLAARGLTRRRSRSVATAAMLASGTFLIVSIGVFRLDANRDATKRDSGTGGFALIGESTMPVVADLNTKAGRESFALNEADFAEVKFVQFRVRAGDEASCLNLNRAQKPRLLGVKPEALGDRFTFNKLLRDVKPRSPWSLINIWVYSETGVLGSIQSPSIADGAVPAIGDAASIEWAMGKKVGDTLDYVDERGKPFKVRIVGAVANSILQGQLIIDERDFVARFPSESGYKYFLIDVPTNRLADVSAKLSRALQDVGLELTPASQRLAQFNAVQNTYLGTFQILGGLGLLLGSAGLGIVVLRNVLERRGELAVLLAVGWRRSAVSALVLREHLILLAVGLAIGVAAAVVAVLPSLLTPGGEFPWLTLSVTLAAVLVNGVVWTWLAAQVALRGDLLTALRGS